MITLEEVPVTRVRTSTGSYVEPPLDPGWDDLTKLQWHAAVVSYDTGLNVHISPGDSSIKRFGEWRKIHGTYSVRCGASSTILPNFHSTWTYLNGISMGARASREE